MRGNDLQLTKVGRRASATAQDRITFYGPKSDGTHIVEFKTATGRSVGDLDSRTEAGVIRHFQAKMRYGLVVPDVKAVMSERARQAS